MSRIVKNLSIQLRRAIHSLILLLPQGLRTALTRNSLLTRIFVFFDDARYTPTWKNGVQESLWHLQEPGSATTPIINYKFVEPIFTKEIQDEVMGFLSQPLISIIMPVYNSDPNWLNLAISSIKNQWYSNWEICMSDDHSNNPTTREYLTSIIDPRVKIKYLPENQGISMASNAALSLADGEFVVMMDHDDVLTPDALFEIVKAINECRAEFIYSDEDKLEMNGTFSEPHFKPDFTSDLLLSQNYLSHLGAIKKDLVDRVGGFTQGMDGAQDYDLYLKVLEHTNKVTHIPKVLYHWRKVPGSTAAIFNYKNYAQDAGAIALANAVERRCLDATVHSGQFPGTYRVKYRIKGEPLVSIIIPYKDKPELLKMCFESILIKSTYTNFEIIGISNNSEEAATENEMERLAAMDRRVIFHQHNAPFNFSEINNYAVSNYANGEHILLLNNDIEIISPSWIESMLEFSQRNDVGVVGAKLFYPDNQLQHAGIIIGIGGIAGHSHKNMHKKKHGYFLRPHIVQNLSAVTAACCMVSKKVYEEVGGLDAVHLKIAFNDVDFCLRIREKGYLNVFTPYCEAYHHESVSRGYEITAEQQNRFNQEVEYMEHRHADILRNGDPYYNHQLSLHHEDFSLAASE